PSSRLFPPHPVATNVPPYAPLSRWLAYALHRRIWPKVPSKRYGRTRTARWQLQLQRCGRRDHAVKEVRVHNLGQDFQPHDNARTRPAKVVMLDHIDLTRTHCLEVPPTVLCDQGI